ncbi:hypothetical protein [Protaetiibacter larvae]|uniref:DUF927 domain-containing protein n=1 Tax=Protaetiibacter larvae TaxID=2592654 RepID=A0A5C1YCF0_9MICO|nr:hypothetical protein [Protaetiibacter larvae]QEO10557.1 hypothetical protein FLP23_11430 [Protaetiibacter larvae]
MSATTDALDALIADYVLMVNSAGEGFTVPRDPSAPRVAMAADALVSDFLYRLDREHGIDAYSRTDAVRSWLDTRLTISTAGRLRVPVALRAHQVVDDDTGAPRLLIDLGDPEVGFFIDVRAGGWTLFDPRVPGADERYPVDERPVFTRPSTDFRALPIPRRGEVRGEGRDWLRGALNLSERDWRLVWGWMLTAYFSQWDRQGLLFVAPTKVGKTLRAGMVLRFIQPSDPHADGIGADFPESQREWGSLIAGNAVLAFDDVERISDKAHGNLKRIVTGVAFKTQTLYKTSGLTVTRGKRPLVLTASGTPSGLRDDLRNRLWLVEPTAPPVGDRLRSTFEHMAPAIFADLLDDLADALALYLPAEGELARQISETGVGVRPLEVTALFRALDRAQGLDPSAGFEQAARDALQDSLMEAASGDRFAYTVRVFLSGHPDGGVLSSQDLLAGLAETARELFPDSHPEREDWFPKDATRMGTFFTKKADSLNEAGVYLAKRMPDRNTRGWAWEPIPEDLRVYAPTAPAPVRLPVRTSDSDLSGPAFPDEPKG